ncbi:MAG TPA: hypothetical protein VHT03_07545 [Rhizomicrobium sp.]|nr:hypothetical protein [Rhizomicrobium sp.]
MTGKLPVERTITDAYRFAFLRFLSVLGTLWLPYLVLVLLTLGLIRLVAPDVPRMLSSGELDLGAGLELLRLAILVAVFAFIIGAMITIDLQRKAMGTHTGPDYLFFSLRGPVWRMAAASFLATIVVGVVTLLAALLCFAIWSAAGALGAAGGLIRLLVVLATIALVVYVALRLMFFLPAVVVAENSIGLERAWILGGQNFWRILIVGIAVILPVAIVFHLLSWAIFGPIAGLRELGGAGGLKALLRAGAMQYGAKGWLMLFIEVLERILLIGLFNGAIASAYLAVGRASQSPVPPPSV